MQSVWEGAGHTIGGRDIEHLCSKNQQGDGAPRPSCDWQNHLAAVSCPFESPNRRNKNPMGVVVPSITLEYRTQECHVFLCVRADHYYGFNARPG